jgi:hypothetical protein
MNLKTFIVKYDWSSTELHSKYESSIIVLQLCGIFKINIQTQASAHYELKF